MNNNKINYIDISSSNSELVESESERPSKVNPHLIYSKYNKKLNAKNNISDSSITSSNISINSKNSENNIKREVQMKKVTYKNNDLQKELLKLKAEYENLKGENNILKIEKEKIVKVKNNEIALMNEKVSRLENQNKKLSLQYEHYDNKIEEYTSKVEQYDEISQKYKLLKNERDDIINKNAQLKEQIDSMRKELNDLNDKYSSCKYDNDNLRKDKLLLTKAKILQEETIASLNRQIKSLEEEKAKNDKENKEYIKELTEQTVSMDDVYKTKLKEELSQMKLKYENDIQLLKANYDEISNKKISSLQEQIEEYKSSLSKCDSLLKEKDNTISMLHKEINDLHSKSNEDLSSMTIKLNQKIEEHNAKEEQIDKIIALNSILKNENDSLEEKNILIKEEMLKKENELRNELNTLHAEIAILKEKNSLYESNEKQLTKILTDSLSGYYYNPSNDTKLNQCIQIANRVKVLTVDNERLKNLNKQMTTELKSLHEQINLLKGISDCSTQPNSSIVKSLKESELKLFELTKENEKKNQTIAKLTKEKSQYEDKISSLENDMKTLISNRQKLTQYENILNSYMNTSELPSDSQKVPSWYVKLQSKKNI